MSGRYLRKLPFIACANQIQRSSCTLDQFLIAMSKTVEKQKYQQQKLKAQNL